MMIIIIMIYYTILYNIILYIITIIIIVIITINSGDSVFFMINITVAIIVISVNHTLFFLSAQCWSFKSNTEFLMAHKTQYFFPHSFPIITKSIIFTVYYSNIHLSTTRGKHRLQQLSCLVRFCFLMNSSNTHQMLAVDSLNMEREQSFVGKLNWFNNEMLK